MSTKKKPSPDSIVRELKRYAKKQGRTLGGLVRDALDEGHRILSKMIKAGFYSPVKHHKASSSSYIFYGIDFAPYFIRVTFTTGDHALGIIGPGIRKCPDK